MLWNERALRLYAVTDRRWLCGKPLPEAVEYVLKGGATCVQLREKALGDKALLEEACSLATICHRYGAPLLINDCVEAVVRSGADGVHLGQEDMNVAAARARLGKEKIIGVTAKTVDQALRAQKEGADYLGCGAIFGSETKPNAVSMRMETLREICRAVTIPVVAIGNVNLGNIVQLAGVGVAGAAVISGIFAAENIEQECRNLRAWSERIVSGI